MNVEKISPAARVRNAWNGTADPWAANQRGFGRFSKREYPTLVPTAINMDLVPVALLIPVQFLLEILKLK